MEMSKAMQDVVAERERQQSVEGWTPQHDDEHDECVEREIIFRIRVYARRVAEGKMSQEKSDQELAAMRAVLGTLQGIAGAAR